VINRTRRQVESKNESLSAVIHGVDDAWEVCLLKFTIDLSNVRPGTISVISESAD